MPKAIADILKLLEYVALNNWDPHAYRNFCVEE